MRTLALTTAMCLVAAAAMGQRLPLGVSPEHYTLWLAPDLEKETFRGRESIRVNVSAPTRSITLHAAEIEFGQVMIESGGRSQRAQVTLNQAAETATLSVPVAIPLGAATIDIAYTGTLNDDLRGFYVSRANGRKYAVSQMEATDARRAFPSFDEPSYKATFAVTLMIDAGDTAISNGKQMSDTPGPEPGKHTIVFAPTPKMSSYLVALLVGDFVCRSGAAGPTPIRVCSTPDKLALTAFALTAAQQQVAFFNEYFGIPYPYEKLDIIGVPDFAAGAMENAGAITFRERLLLADEQTASIAIRKSVASVISHELAHQWFGNLVTMKWWDDIWLNEGFATWAANKPLAAWKPEWNMALNAATETQAAIGLDSMRSTRAIHTAVNTPAEIGEVFDLIAYQKTAGVLGMVEAYVGPEKFREGVSSYLSKHALGNAAGEDFWNEMTRVTEKPVHRIMKSLVEQPGTPLLSVKTKCVNETTEIAITQSRLIASPTAPRELTSAHWTLPVCVKAANGTSSCTVVSEPAETIRVPGCGATLVNADAHGYYVTDYEPAALTALARRTLTPPEKISLLGDEWRLVRAGRHDIGGYLDLAAAFARDTTPEVVSEMAFRIGTVLSDIADTAQRPAFEAWIRKHFRPTLDSIGVSSAEGDSDAVNQLRGTLLQFLSSDPDLQKRARGLAERYLDQPTAVPPSLVSSVLQVAAAGGDARLYERYVAKMKASTSAPEEYYRFFNALAAFKTAELRARTLKFALSDEVRSQDAPLLVAQQLVASSSQDAAWAFVKSEWAAVSGKIKPNAMPAVANALGAFCSPAMSADIRAFFAAHPVPEAARTLQQTYERIATCAAIDERQSPAFAKWLAAQH